MTEIHLFDIYRSANIGIFLKANEKFCLIPHGLATTKRDKIHELLHVQTIPTSVAGSRLLGPLTAVNSHGIIISRLSDEEEVRQLSGSTGLNVLKLESRFTSIGNLMSVNDHGAIISDVFSEESAKEVERVLKVPVKRMRIGSFIQVGAMIAATNSGILVHPIASESELSVIRDIMGLEPEPATVNGGVPFVSSGLVGNSSVVLAGAQTRGSELIILGRAFS
ncbi:MAG TPA: translation initiation factor IF-6 [Nitrososphaerales archaeon]|nr:translation initiation factor IF-6 [Nitrososphaerales archaeon]